MRQVVAGGAGMGVGFCASTVSDASITLHNVTLTDNVIEGSVGAPYHTCLRCSCSTKPFALLLLHQALVHSRLEEVAFSASRVAACSRAPCP
jgi:hypothetical protein